MPQDQEMQEFYAAAKRSGLLDQDPEIRDWSRAAIRAGIITDTTPPPSPRARGKAARRADTGVMMDQLADPNRPENRAAAPMAAPARAPAPGAAGGGPTSGLGGFLNRMAGAVESIPGIGPALLEQAGMRAQHPLEYPGRDVGRATTAAVNETARQLRRGNLKGAPAAATRAAREAYPRAGTDVEPRMVREALGVGPKSPAALRWGGAVADFVVGARMDPANVVMDPALRAAGGAVAAGVRKLAPKAVSTATTVTAKVAGKFVRPGNPIDDLAREYAIAGLSGSRAGKAHFSNADLMRLQQAVKDAGVDPNEVIRRGDTLITRLNARVATLEAKGKGPFKGITDPAQLGQARRQFAEQTLRRPGAVAGVDRAGKAAFGEGRLDAAREMARNVMAFAGAGPRAKEVAEDMRQALRAHPILKVPSAVAGTAKGLMLANPGSAAVNAFGGFLQGKIALDRAGVAGDLMFPFVARARKVVKEAMAGKVSPLVQEFEAQFPKGMSPLGGFEDVVGAPKPSGAVVKAATAFPRAMLGAQDVADRTNKLAAYMAMRAKGVPAPKAAKIVNDVMFNYSDRSAMIELVDRWGIAPFSTFGSKALKGLVEGAVEQPHLLRRFMAARERMYQDPEARAAYDKLPEYEQGLFTLPLGKNLDGTFAFINAQRYNPYGSAMKTVEAAAETLRTHKPPKGFLLQQVSRPLIVGPVANLVFNRKLMGDDPERLAKVSHPGAPPGKVPPLREMPQALVDLHNPHVRELLKAHAPSGRLVGAVVEAIQGKTPGDAKTQQAQPVSRVFLQQLAGLRESVGETVGETEDERYKEKVKRLKPLMKERKADAKPFIDKLTKLYRTRVANNLFLADVAELAPKEARQLAAEARSYLNSLRTSGRVIDSRGRLTAEGKARIKAAIAYREALRFRSLDKK